MKSAMIVVNCPRCQKRQEVPAPAAGTQVRCSNVSCAMAINVPLRKPPAERAVSHVPQLRKYPALAWLLRILAVLFEVATGAVVVIGIVLCTRTHTDVLGAIVIAAGVLIGALVVLVLLAIAEGMVLLLDIESTLREIRDRLPATGNEDSSEPDGF